jgi:hypothetical protein
LPKPEPPTPTRGRRYDGALLEDTASGHVVVVFERFVSRRSFSPSYASPSSTTRGAFGRARAWRSPVPHPRPSRSPPVLSRGHPGLPSGGPSRCDAGRRGARLDESAGHFTQPHPHRLHDGSIGLVFAVQVTSNVDTDTAIGANQRRQSALRRVRVRVATPRRMIVRCVVRPLLWRASRSLPRATR